MKTTNTTIISTTETKGNCRPVICVETNTFFPSIMDAARFYNTKGVNIVNVLKGRQRTTRGLSFRYAEDCIPCENCKIATAKHDDLAELKRKAAAYDAIMAQREMTHRLADLKTKRDKIETEIKNLEQQLKSLGGIL